jgi:hypothetical protein
MGRAGQASGAEQTGHSGMLGTANATFEKAFCGSDEGRAKMTASSWVSDFHYVVRGGGGKEHRKSSAATQ